MALLVTNEAEGIMLEAIVNKTAPQTLILCLYGNDVTPAEAHTAASYTELTATNNYANVSLTGASWSVTTGDPSYASYAQQTFSFTGSHGNVYGYFLKQTTSGKLMWVERFSDGPYNIQNSGDAIKITPRIELS